MIASSLLPLQLNATHSFFPPHCTPILQPCDQNVNHIFKAQYELHWREWMDRVGSQETNVTRYGNPAAAGKDTYMAWIGLALGAIDEKVIADSWRMSCAGYKRTVFHLQPALWKRIVAFIPAAWDKEIVHITHCRKLYTAWRTCSFPTTVRKRNKTVVVATTSAPTKRRKATRADSDNDTGPEADTVMDDKENQPPPQSEQDALREERYQMLMTEQHHTGSIRVLDKRVTSALWQARLGQPLQSLHLNGSE